MLSSSATLVKSGAGSGGADLASRCTAIKDKT